MIIAATSDYDIPEFNIKTFIQALEGIKEPDILLFCGDMYDYRRPKRYKDIIEILDKIGWKCPAIAIPGNHEFEEDYAKIKENCGKRIIFIDDEALIIKNKIGIVGSKGCLDQPTFWQMGNIVGIKDIYENRTAKIKKLLLELKTPVKILLTHYSPTYKTLMGESPTIYGSLGSKRFESILLETNVTFAIHGHAHYGIPLAFIKNIPIFNVAYPVNKKIVEIDTDKLPKTGLQKFV